MLGQTARWRREAHLILKQRRPLEALSGGELLRRAQTLQWSARSGTPLRSLMRETFALGIEAARRRLEMTHFPVQVMGAIALFEGHITEMQTGEGKTLTVTLPAILRSLPGKGVHVVTANDYLARRDAEQMRHVYSLLGLSTGCIQQPLQDAERLEAYGCDITYGTASEMGFDFLRDRLKRGASNYDEAIPAIFDRSSERGAQVQRGHYCALIDEADSILIDEARTPLIIGVEQPNREAMVSLFRWSIGVLRHLQLNEDYLFNPRERNAHLTDAGCRKIVLLSKPVLLDTIDTERIYEQVERALTATLAYQRDRDYVVHDGEVHIVDEGTGRKMDGRKWQDGLHQTIEAKERIDVTGKTTSAAKVTIQSLFRHYENLSGMTGTATQAGKEFRRVYSLSVSVIPTNRTCIREGLPTRVFATQAAKYAAVVQAVTALTAHKRAVLIGTPSVDASEVLSAALKQAQLHHVVLNAHYHEQEADIISGAGAPGRVTIATNMAGRGTDILLSDDVRQNGGLHVIATEMHSSKRIDRQLIGRAARQGDPGSYQFFLSLEDELLRALTRERHQRLIHTARPNAQGELSSSWVNVFRRTQRSLEKLHTRQRKLLLKFEKQQRERYRKVGLDPYLEMADS